VRPPVLPAYVPVDRMPVRVAENGVRIGRGCDALCTGRKVAVW
jgi:hypothetical protein